MSTPIDRQSCGEESHLLPKADTRTRVEWEEDERVRGQVLLKALVEETIRVELQSCRRETP